MISRLYTNHRSEISIDIEQSFQESTDFVVAVFLAYQHDIIWVVPP